jgi:hypothetical protein
MSTFIYLIVSGLVFGRPWWLIVSAVLVLPEITRGTLEEFGNAEWKRLAGHRIARRATQSLSVVGLLLLILGMASM